MNPDNEFIIVLPSNTPSTVENTPADYLTTFNDPIYLDGEWQVALMEISFKNSIKTIHQDKIKVYKREWKELKPYKFFIKNKHIHTIKQFSKDEWYYFKTDYTTDEVVFGDKNKDGKLNYAMILKNNILLQAEIVNYTKHDLNLEMPMYIAQIFGFANNTDSLDMQGTFNITVYKNSKETSRYLVRSASKHIKNDKSVRSFHPLTPFVKGQDFNLGITAKYESYMYEPLACTVTPKPGTYASAEDLISELNKELEHLQLNPSGLYHPIYIPQLPDNP